MKALIIDDEPLARNELTYLLNEIGGFEEINEAENVKETLEALLINQYDIIFLDVNLMDENGIELGAKIQKMKEPPAIIFATAHDQYAVQQQNIIGIGTHNGITTIHTTNHKYETTEPLNRYEKRLNPTYFIRIHRSYIINTKHIKEVQQWFNYTYMVILTNGVKMQVGRSFMKDFKASIGLL